MNSNNRESWELTRSITEANEFINDKQKKSADRKGYVRKPIIDFIEFKDCVVDTLHLLLRISECLLKSLMEKLDLADSIIGKFNTADLTLRPNLKKFLDFLQCECKIYSPYYIKERDTDGVQVKLRSLNSNELETFFNRLKKDTILTMFPSLKKELNRINFCLIEFWNIYCLIKNSQRPFYSIDELKIRLKNWVEVFMKMSCKNSSKFTPYIHIFVHHIPEFLLIHGEIDSFNCQGLEKLNHLIKMSYFSNSNKHSKEYLKQLLQKRNREEFIEQKGTIEEIETLVQNRNQ